MIFDDFLTVNVGLGSPPPHTRPKPFPNSFLGPNSFPTLSWGPTLPQLFHGVQTLSQLFPGACKSLSDFSAHLQIPCRNSGAPAGALGWPVGPLSDCWGLPKSLSDPCRIIVDHCRIFCRILVGPFRSNTCEERIRKDLKKHLTLRSASNRT